MIDPPCRVTVTQPACIYYPNGFFCCRLSLSAEVVERQSGRLTEHISQLIDIAGICKLDIRMNQRHSLRAAALAKSGSPGVMLHGVTGAQEAFDQ
jgi:hypothetical protein